MSLKIEHLSKSFGDTTVLADISLTISRGEIIALLGPSGCGKTTLLRLIAGLEQADSGVIAFQGSSLSNVPVHERNFGMVFQDYALFPHKNVDENIGFGLKMAGWPATRRSQRVQQMLELVGLAGLGDRPVHALSGGEQQRVALARSLAPRPSLLLLDEPLGALDRALRERLMLELRDILKRAGDESISIYVTHDQVEAYALADRIIVMNSGRIEQIATPQELFLRPRTPFVAQFLGMGNVLDAVPTAKELAVQTRLGELVMVEKLDRGQKIMLRPDGAELVRGITQHQNHISGRLVNRSFRGRFLLITVQPHAAESVRLSFELPAATTLPDDGDEIMLRLAAGTIVPLEAS